jgi:hypothetical protein
MKRFLIMAMLAACGGDDEADEPIAEQNLTGLIDGEAWDFAAGHTNAFLSEDSDTFFASLYAEEFEACAFGEPTGPHLILSIPKEPGERKLSLGLNMTFVLDNEDNDNLIGIRGKIRVDEVTATSVTGAIRASFDSDNEVEGEFNVTVCPPDE